MKLFNILKKIIFIYFIILLKKNKKFIYIKNNLKKKIIKSRKKNKKIKFKILKKIKIYCGYILCSNKCPKIINKIKNKKEKIFIFLSINRKENSYIIEKLLNKIKKNKIYGVGNNLKKINEISKIMKIIYKYKKNKINHSELIFKINKNIFYKNK